MDYVVTDTETAESAFRPWRRFAKLFELPPNLGNERVMSWIDRSIDQQSPVDVAAVRSLKSGNRAKYYQTDISRNNVSKRHTERFLPLSSIRPCVADSRPF